MKKRATAFLAVMILGFNAMAGLPEQLPPGDYEPKNLYGSGKVKYDKSLTPEQVRELRDNSFRNAKVWVQPSTPISEAKLDVTSPIDGNFEGAFDPNTELYCRWVWSEVGGKSRKFYCVLPGGDLVKVRYSIEENDPQTGESKIKKFNPEVFGSMAAQRLLRALGFGAHRSFLVKKIRCFGCPPNPHEAALVLSSPWEDLRIAWVKNNGGVRKIIDGRETLVYPINYDRYQDFQMVAIERKMFHKEISPKVGSTEIEGWSFKDLDSNVASTTAEKDALKILAAMLNHGDAKAKNQDLMCADEVIGKDGICRQPRAIIGDLGVTFGAAFSLFRGMKFLPGQEGLRLKDWNKACIWKEGEEGRTIKVKGSPNSSLKTALVSKEGREFLTSLLEQLSDQQLTDLFVGAQVSKLPFENLEDRNPQLWVAAFKEKIRQVKEGTCPAR